MRFRTFLAASLSQNGLEMALLSIQPLMSDKSVLASATSFISLSSSFFSPVFPRSLTWYCFCFQVFTIDALPISKHALPYTAVGVPPPLSVVGPASACFFPSSSSSSPSSFFSAAAASFSQLDPWDLLQWVCLSLLARSRKR